MSYPSPDRQTGSRSGSHSQPVARHSTTVIPDYSPESSSAPPGYVHIQQSRGQPPRVPTDPAKAPMSALTNRVTAPAALFQPFSVDLQQIQSSSRASPLAGAPAVSGQPRTQSLPAFAPGQSIPPEGMQQTRHVEQQLPSSISRHPPGPLPARHEAVQHYHQPPSYAPTQAPRPPHPITQAHQPAAHAVGQQPPVIVNASSHHLYATPKTATSTPPLASPSHHTSRVLSPHDHHRPEAHNHHSHPYHPQSRSQPYAHPPAHPPYAHTAPQHPPRSHLSPEQPFSSVPLPTNGHALPPGPAPQPSVPQSHRGSIETLHSLPPSSSGTSRAQSYPPPPSAHPIAPQTQSQPQLAPATMQRDAQPHAQPRPSGRPHTPAPAQEQSQSQTAMVAPDSSPRSLHGPPPPAAFPSTPYPKGQPPQSVVSFAALALTPVQSMYEQAWSMTVGNVQQEMHRMHHGFTVLVDTERARHERTFAKLQEETRRRERCEAELGAVRRENGELRREVERLRAEEGERERERERKRPRLVGSDEGESENDKGRVRDGWRGADGVEMREEDRTRHWELKVAEMSRELEEQTSMRLSTEKKLTEAMGKLKAITDSVLSPLGVHHPIELPTFGARAEGSTIASSTVHNLLRAADVKYPISPPAHARPSFATSLTASPSPISETISIKVEDRGLEGASGDAMVVDSTTRHGSQVIHGRVEEARQASGRSLAEPATSYHVHRSPPERGFPPHSLDQTLHHHHQHQPRVHAPPTRNDHQVPLTPPSPLTTRSHPHPASMPISLGQQTGQPQSQSQAQSRMSMEAARIREREREGLVAGAYASANANLNANQSPKPKGASVPVSAPSSSVVAVGDREERGSTGRLASSATKPGATVLNWPPPMIIDSNGTTRSILNMNAPNEAEAQGPLSLSATTNGAIPASALSRSTADHPRSSAALASAGAIQFQKVPPSSQGLVPPIQGQANTRTQSQSQSAAQSRTQTPVQAHLQAQTQQQPLLTLSSMKAPDQPQTREQGPQQHHPTTAPRTQHVSSPSPVPRVNATNGAAANVPSSSLPSNTPAPATSSSSASVPKNSSSSPVPRHAASASASGSSSPLKKGLGSLPILNSSSSAPATGNAGCTVNANANPNAINVRNTRSPSTSPPNPAQAANPGNASVNVSAAGSLANQNGNEGANSGDSRAGAVIATTTVTTKQASPEISTRPSSVHGGAGAGSGSSAGNGSGTNVHGGVGASASHSAAAKQGPIIPSHTRDAASSGASQLSSGSLPKPDSASSKSAPTVGSVVPANPSSESPASPKAAAKTVSSSSAPVPSSEKGGERISVATNTSANNNSSNPTIKPPLPSPPYSTSSLSGDAPRGGARTPTPNQNRNDRPVLHITTNGSPSSTPASAPANPQPQAPPSTQSYYRRDAQPPTGPRDRRGSQQPHPGYPHAAAASSPYPAASALYGKRVAESLQSLQSVEGQQQHMNKFRLEEVPPNSGARPKSPDGAGRKRSRGEYEQQDRERDGKDGQARGGRPTPPPRSSSAASQGPSGQQQQSYSQKRMKSDSAPTSSPSLGREPHKLGSDGPVRASSVDSNGRGRKDDVRYDTHPRRNEASGRTAQALEEGEVPPEDGKKSQSQPEEGELKTPTKEAVPDAKGSSNNANTQPARKVHVPSAPRGLSSSGPFFSSRPGQPAPPTAPKSKIGINHMDILYDTKGDKMICRMCLQFSSRPRNGSKTGPASFSIKATWPELMGHCQNEHPDAWTALEKLSPSQVAEMRQRIMSGSIPRFPTSK